MFISKYGKQLFFTTANAERCLYESITYKRYSDVDYIQNEIINENKHIWANNVLIGSDVTSDLKNGNVSIESGSTIIYGSNVTIQNDFEVKLGAKLCIKIFK
jgi:hypothetical protein